MYRQSPSYGGGSVPGSMPQAENCRKTEHHNYNGNKQCLSAVKLGYSAVNQVMVLKNRVNGAVSQVP